MGIIHHPVGFRVRRLGYYDDTQRQLGERALYVFPAKGDTTRITCEGPESAPVLPDDLVVRNVSVYIFYSTIMFTKEFTINVYKLQKNELQLNGLCNKLLIQV